MRKIFKFISMLSLAAACVFGAKTSEAAVVNYTTDDGLKYSFSNEYKTELAVVGCDFEKNDGNIVIPSKVKGHDVTSIGDEAFMYSSSLLSVEMPDTIEKIGDYAFYECTGLTSVTIPDSVETLGECAFAGATNLETIEIPANTTNIGAGAFARTKWMEKQENINPLVIVNDIVVDGYYCTGDVVIPEGVVEICADAFNSLYKPTSIKLPDTLKKIGECAFWGLDNVDINIPKDVESIAYNAFKPSEITGITVDDENAVYDSRDDCNALISTSDNKLIIGCKTTKIPETVTAIGTYAFDGVDIQTITIPKSVTTIEKYAFFNSNLTKITIPGSVTSIEEGTFSGCVYLTDVTLNDTLKNIGKEAFYECESLENIEIPEGTYIGKDAFKYTKWLNNQLAENAYVVVNGILLDAKVEGVLTVPDGVFEISGCRSSKVTSVVFSDSVVVIGDGAFKNQSNLVSVEIPGTVSEIGSSAFWGCSALTSVKMEEGVKSIGDYAFTNCYNLSEVEVPESVVEIGKYIFDDCKTIKVYTPKGSEAYYYFKNDDMGANSLDLITDGQSSDVTPTPTATVAPVNPTVAPVNPTVAPTNPAQTATPKNTVAPAFATKAPTAATQSSVSSSSAVDDSDSEDDSKLTKVTIKSAKNSAKGVVVVKWKKVKKAAGYQVQYSLKKNFKGKKSKNTKAAKIKLKKLKSKKKYFIRVRAFKIEDGEFVYGKWSKVECVKVKK